MPAGPWVLVVGCHRSGTSAVTGALVSMGLHGVDATDRMEWTPSNPEHWESLGAALYNEAVLAGADAAWDAPPPLADEPLVVADAPGLADPAAVMATAYPASGALVWKDPRVCLLLPHWRRLLPGPLTAVLVWRKPLEVARSLHARDGMPLVDGLALWERYNRSAAAGLQGVDTYVVDYDDVLEDPEGTFGAIAGWLTALDRFDTPWDVAAAAATIDRRLHHESADGDGADPDGPQPTHGAVEDWLVAEAGPHEPLDTVPGPSGSPWPEAVLETRREAARWRRQSEASDAELVRRSDEHAEVVRMLEALVRSRDVRIHVLTSDLEGEVQAYDGIKAELDRMRNSTSWKVTAPLRAALARLSDALH